MPTIIVDLIPRGRRNRPGYPLNPRYLTIHDTANTGTGAGAKAHALYLKGDSAASIPASWHFTVDDTFIVQHLPLDENGWHAGDGKEGPGNRTSIGIEICENRDGIRAEAEKRAAWLTAKLLRDFSLKPVQVKQHHHWSGKNCPRVLRGRPGGWDSFLEAVRLQLPSSGITPLAGKAAVTAAQAQEWARKRQAHPRFIEIAPVYWSCGARTGLRPEVLYAQSAKETAFGRYGGAVKASQNNWAGIKVEQAVGDSTADFETFVSPEEGVRGHFNHMCAYVGLKPVGEPHGRYRVVLAQPWAGQVCFVEELGGRWAVDADYGFSIVRDYLNGLLATLPPLADEPPPEPPMTPPGELPEKPAPLPEPDPPGVPEPEPGTPEKPEPGEGASPGTRLFERLLYCIYSLLKGMTARLERKVLKAPERGGNGCDKRRSEAPGGRS
ncbi:MAG: hypothetical protein GX883_05570 [Firmicutes bacterium]|nr:hypothetical protein [Bacillota bacterium]